MSSEQGLCHDGMTSKDPTRDSRDLSATNVASKTEVINLNSRDDGRDDVRDRVDDISSTDGNPAIDINCSDRLMDRGHEPSNYTNHAEKYIATDIRVYTHVNETIANSAEMGYVDGNHELSICHDHTTKPDSGTDVHTDDSSREIPAVDTIVRLDKTSDPLCQDMHCNPTSNNAIKTVDNIVTDVKRRLEDETARNSVDSPTADSDVIHNCGISTEETCLTADVRTNNDKSGHNLSISGNLKDITEYVCNNDTSTNEGVIDKDQNIEKELNSSAVVTSPPKVQISAVSEAYFIASISDVTDQVMESHSSKGVTVIPECDGRGSSQLNRDCTVDLHDVFSQCCEKGMYDARLQSTGMDNGRRTDRRGLLRHTSSRGGLSAHGNSSKGKGYTGNVKKAVGKNDGKTLSSHSSLRNVVKGWKVDKEKRKIICEDNSKGKKIKRRLSANINMETATSSSTDLTTDDNFVKPNYPKQMNISGKYRVGKGKELLDWYIKTKHYSLLEGASLPIDSKKYRSECKVCDCVIEDRNLLKLHEIGVHTDRKAFVCKACPHVCEALKDMRRHLYGHYSTKRFQCPQCSFKAKAPAYVQRHVKNVHTTVRRFSCNMCGVRMKRMGHLMIHMLRHQAVKRFSCDQCPFKALTRYEVTQHRVTHTDVWLFRCDVSGCGRKTRTKSDLVKHHRLVHMETRPFGCDKCNKRFKTKSSLHVHATSHDENRLWTCDICHKGMKTRSALTRHADIHQGNYPYPCDTCDKKFITASARKLHALTHVVSEARPFHCPVCMSTSATMPHLLGHIGSNHHSTHVFYCDFCFKPYVSFFYLVRHLQLTHMRDFHRDPSKHYLLDILKPEFAEVKPELQDYDPIESAQKYRELLETSAALQSELGTSACDSASKIPIFRDFTLPLATAGFKFNLQKTGRKQDDRLVELGVITADEAESRRQSLIERRAATKNKSVKGQSVKVEREKRKISPMKSVEKDVHVKGKKSVEKDVHVKGKKSVEKDVHVKGKKSVAQRRADKLSKAKKKIIKATVKSKMPMTSAEKLQKRLEAKKTKAKNKENASQRKNYSKTALLDLNEVGEKATKKKRGTNETESMTMVKKQSGKKFNKSLPKEKPIALKRCTIVLETLKGEVISVISNEKDKQARTSPRKRKRTNDSDDFNDLLKSPPFKKPKRLLKKITNAQLLVTGNNISDDSMSTELIVPINAKVKKIMVSKRGKTGVVIKNSFNEKVTKNSKKKSSPSKKPKLKGKTKKSVAIKVIVGKKKKVPTATLR